MFSIKVIYKCGDFIWFYVRDLFAAATLMTSINNDSVDPKFEIYKINKEDL